MVYEFEFYRPSYYNSRLYSYYYPTSRTPSSSYERPYSAARYYKPYWSYSPYSPYNYASYNYPYSYRPFRPSYAYDYPYYIYRDYKPKVSTLSEFIANDEIDRLKRSIRAKSVELDNYNLSYGTNTYTEKLLRDARATSVPRFIRETSLEPSFNRYLRSSLERDFY